MYFSVKQVLMANEEISVNKFIVIYHYKNMKIFKLKDRA